MKNSFNNQIKTKIYQLERALRLLRIQIENEIHIEGGEDRLESKTINLENPISKFLTSGNSILERQVSPYEHFSPGLSCSHALDGSANKILVSALGHMPVDGMLEPSTSLLLKINIDKKQPSAWFSLEANLDVESFRKCKSISMSISPYFRVAENVELDNFSVVLRGFAKSSYHDYYSTSFPSLSVPMEFQYSINREKYLNIPFGEFSELKIIIFLPIRNASNYAFGLAGMDVYGEIQ